MARKTFDFPYIRAWGHMMGSFQYYIDEQLRKAREDGAPETAIYRNDDGSWCTWEGIKSEHTKALIKEKADALIRVNS